VVDFGRGGEGVGNFKHWNASGLEDGVNWLAPGEQGSVGLGQRLARGAAEETVEDHRMQAVNLGEPGALDEQGLGQAGSGVEHQAHVGARADALAQAGGEG
jgi:hypothetical protein